MAGSVTLVLGGARSGKSAVAERLADQLGDGVTYLATAATPEGDAAFLERVATHRSRRPESWSTVEVGADLAGALAERSGPALVDSLGTWLAGTSDFAVDVETLCRALSERDGPTVVVSDEVGLGVVPSTEVGNRFRDALGAVNVAVAAVAHEVLLVVAGRVLRLDVPPPGTLS